MRSELVLVDGSCLQHTLLHRECVPQGDTCGSWCSSMCVEVVLIAESSCDRRMVLVFSLHIHHTDECIESYCIKKDWKLHHRGNLDTSTSRCESNVMMDEVTVG